MKNPKYGPAEFEAYKARFEELRNNLPRSFTGFEYDFTKSWADLTPEQRTAWLQEVYADRSLKLWLASFAEIFIDEEVSAQVSDFMREKMRASLEDLALTDILIPGRDDYGFATHRLPLETNYLEVYHRPNVIAVPVKDKPIAEITSEGIRLADGKGHELDIIILATGFNAGSGALSRIDIRGRDGQLLRDLRSRDIRTLIGLMVHGFPNMMITGAPLAPLAALCNMTICLQQQAEWIAGLIATMREAAKRVVEPIDEFEQAWVDHHDAVMPR